MARGQAGQEGGQSQWVHGVSAWGFQVGAGRRLASLIPKAQRPRRGASRWCHPGGSPPRRSHSQLSCLLASTRTFPFPSDLSWVCSGRSGAGAGAAASSYEDGPRWGKGAPGLSLETLVGAGAPIALPHGFQHSPRWEFPAAHCIDGETEARSSAKAELVCQTPNPTCVASGDVITKGGCLVCFGNP